MPRKFEDVPFGTPKLKPNVQPGFGYVQFATEAAWGAHAAGGAKVVTVEVSPELMKAMKSSGRIEELMVDVQREANRHYWREFDKAMCEGGPLPKPDDHWDVSDFEGAEERGDTAPHTHWPGTLDTGPLRERGASLLVLRRHHPAREAGAQHWKPWDKGVVVEGTERVGMHPLQVRGAGQSPRAVPVIDLKEIHAPDLVEVHTLDDGLVVRVTYAQLAALWDTFAGRNFRIRSVAQ
jgi:hypothetical protein